MKKPTVSANRNKRPLIPAMAAVGGVCGLAALPAGALELGDINVESALGRPLRASIAYALGPNEQLFDFCIFLRPADSFTGVPSVTHARVSLTDGAIVLTGNTAVREPLLNLRLSVDCPYSPHLQREYLLLLDPGQSLRETRTAASVATAAPAEPVTASPPAPRIEARPRVVEATPLSTGSSYRVQTGDTVSAIAARIEDRPVGLWPAVNAIVAANPEAFVDGDVNRLTAGSVLVIPALHDAAPAESVASQAATRVDSPETLPMDEASETETLPVAGETAPSEPRATVAAGRQETIARESQDLAASEPATTPEVSRSIPGMTIVGSEAAAATDEPAANEDVAEPGTAAVTGADAGAAAVQAGNVPMPASDEVDAALPDTDDLKPGDVVLPIQEPTAVAGTASRDVPVVTPTVQRPTDREGGWSAWLAWAGGGVLAVILAFLAFGGKLRDRFRPTPAVRQKRHDAFIDEEAEPPPEHRVTEDLDFNFDDPVVANSMSLDADFSDGSGLDAGDDVDVMQDFGFSAEEPALASLDHEFSDEFTKEPPAAPTDVIPPSHRIEESSILESEVTGDELTGDYDLSMIVDATRQKFGDYGRTAHDLQAVRLDDEYTIEDDTLNSEIGRQVLEKDYEDELSATRARNMEIEKVASELADRLEEQELCGVPAGGETTIESPFGGPVTAADRTMEMPAPGESDMTAELTAKPPADIAAENDESADSGTQRTVDTVAAGSDVTPELQVQSGKVETRKK